jgi:hypothetical protein
VFANEVHLQYSGHHRSNPSAEAYIDTHIRYEVDCYSGRKVAERPIRFACGTARMMPFTLFAPTTAIFISDGKHHPPEGTWHLAIYSQLPPEA